MIPVSVSLYVLINIAGWLYDKLVILPLVPEQLTSGLTGLAVGTGASFLVLGEYKSNSHSSIVPRGLLASLTVCGGVGIIRLWSCGFTVEGILLASGLFLLEAGILLADEIVASGLRARYLKFMADRENTHRFRELVNAAATKANRIEDKKKQWRQSLMN